MANEPDTKKIKGIFDWQGITMTQNQEHKWQDMTLKSLETELHHLRELEVPETLKAKLLAAIPDNSTKVTREQQVKWYQPAWDYGVTAAAAVLIFALMVMVNYGLSVPSQALLMGFDDTSLCYPSWDQNTLLYDQNNMSIADTNYTDYSGRRRPR